MLILNSINPSEKNILNPQLSRVITPHKQESKSESLRVKPTFKSSQRRLKTETNPHALMLASNLQTDLKAKPSPEEIAEILIKYGCTLNQAIFKAASGGDLPSVKKLLDYGVNQNIKNETGKNLVDAACGTGNLDLIDYLIDEKKLAPSDDGFYAALFNLIVLDHLTSKGFSIPASVLKNVLQLYLSGSISLGSPTINPKLPQIDVIKYLIKMNANTSFLSSDKSVSVEISRKLFYLLYNQNSLEIRNQARELIELLLCYELETDFRGSLFRCPIPSGGVYTAYNTPLLVAIASNDIDLVKRLLEAGADPNFSGMSKNTGYRGNDDIGIYEYAGRGELNLGGASPLQVAIQQKHKEIITMLLNNGAK